MAIVAALVAAPRLPQAAPDELAAPGPAAAAPPVPVPLPPGTRWVDGRFVVTRGLAEATRALERALDRAGVAFARVGPYRVRGVEVTRFLSQDPSTPWLAIHLSRSSGRTFLDLVTRTNPLTNPSGTR